MNLVNWFLQQHSAQAAANAFFMDVKSKLETDYDCFEIWKAQMNEWKFACEKAQNEHVSLLKEQGLRAVEIWLRSLQQIYCRLTGPDSADGSDCGSPLTLFPLMRSEERHMKYNLMVDSSMETWRKNGGAFCSESTYEVHVLDYSYFNDGEGFRDAVTCAASRCTTGANTNRNVILVIYPQQHASIKHLTVTQMWILFYV